MKAKLLLVALVCILVALAAWTARTPNPVQADDIPEKYRDTARKGLAYLIKNQFEDGHWEGNGGRHPVAMTGLVGLALLMEMENNSRRGGLQRIPTATHSVNIRKAADWLMEKSQIGRDGLIFSDHPSETARYMEGHGLATLFLAGVCKDERDAARRKRLTEILARAVQYIVKARSTQGGWHHTSKAEGHDFALVSTTVIQIQALQAAENANIPVPDDAIRNGQAYLKMALDKHEAAKAGRNVDRRFEIAASLACCSEPGSRDDEFGKKWLPVCRAEIPMGRDIQFGRDDLAHYYYAQAVFKIGGDAWNAYRATLFDHLQANQNKDGSWPVNLESQGAISVGPVHAAAVWLTILQLDKGSHPSSARAAYVF